MNSVEVFIESFARRKFERRSKEWIKEFTSGFPVEDLRYAAEHNLNIAGTFLKPVARRSMRKKAAPFRHLADRVTTDDFIRLVSEVSPEHASVLRQHRGWLTNQLEIVKEAIFG